MVIPASYHPSVHISAVHPVLSVLGSAFFFFFFRCPGSGGSRLVNPMSYTHSLYILLYVLT